jgi:hypothetical protein
MPQPKPSRQLSLHFDTPRRGSTQTSTAETSGKDNTISLASFRAEKSRRRLVDQLKRSGLLALKTGEN